MKTKDIIEDYDRIYSTSGLRANIAYYRWIVKLLNPKQNSKVLDISCGEGLLLKEITKLNRGIKTFGLDISKVAVMISKRNSPDSKIVIADGQRVPFRDSYFDYVTCLGSLEHYLKPELGLKEMLRVSKEESKFVIVLPNSISIDLILEVLKTGNKPKEDFQIIERKATKKEWVDLLTKNGLNINAVYKSNPYPELFQEGTFKIKSLKKYFKRLLIKIFVPLNLAREFVFICTKDILKNEQQYNRII
ncbi:MAG: class I SAM-dependent methyltransferase [Candidatus Omnitrophica bacterium]|nr:class I SAM-dependent methyltransferase [Candidatus Omnitrophota bacterium]